jgi:hypothetical protein
VSNCVVSGIVTVLVAEESDRHVHRRHDYRPPVIIHAGDKVVRAFASVGWSWGGIWQGARDYQHFSVNGR